MWTSRTSTNTWDIIRYVWKSSHNQLMFAHGCHAFQQNKYVSWVKMTVLLIVWVMFTLFLMSKNEKVLHYRQLAIPKNNIKSKLIYTSACPLTDHLFRSL